MLSKEVEVFWFFSKLQSCLHTVNLTDDLCETAGIRLPLTYKAGTYIFVQLVNSGLAEIPAPQLRVHRAQLLTARDAGLPSEAICHGQSQRRRAVVPDFLGHVKSLNA